MKHSLTITLLLLALFFSSQIIGLSLITIDAKVEHVRLGNATVSVVKHNATVIGERPEVHGFKAVWYIIIAIIIGTVLLLFLSFKKLTSVWKGWFFIAVWMAISIALGVVMEKRWAFIIGLALTVLKVFRPKFLGFLTVIIHNLSEILVYAGIAVLLTPLFNPLTALSLLILIALYDYWAVFKSKHMVTLARFQGASKAFAGLMLSQPEALAKPLKPLQSDKALSKTVKPRKPAAILGGGDVAFPLIFTGSVVEWLLHKGLSKPEALLNALPVTVLATIALAVLFFKSSKDKFYPAMPAITLGCVLGFLIVLAIV